MLGHSGQAKSPLTYTKFAPARPDKAIKWVGAQIWEGSPRSEDLLVADCITEDWAKGLSDGFNQAQTLLAKAAEAKAVIRALLDSVSALAQEHQESDPKVAEVLSTLATRLRADAKAAGFSFT